MDLLGGGGIVLIIVIAVLFGFKKIPEMARSIGRAQGEFKKGLKEGATDDPPEAKAEGPGDARAEGPAGEPPTP